MQPTVASVLPGGCSSALASRGRLGERARNPLVRDGSDHGQAGGHPDVTINYSGEFRESPQLGKTCQCNDPKDSTSASPPGSSAIPMRLRSAPPPTTRAMRAQRTPRSGRSRQLWMPAAVSSSRVDEPLYNMVPRPNQAGLLAARWSRNSSPSRSTSNSRRGRGPTTGSTRKPTGWSGSSSCRNSRSNSGGSRPMTPTRRCAGATSGRRGTATLPPTARTSRS